MNSMESDVFRVDYKAIFNSTQVFSPGVLFKGNELLELYRSARLDIRERNGIRIAVGKLEQTLLKKNTAFSLRRE